MSTCSTPIEYHRLRTPEENHAALVDPPFDRLATIVERNVRLRAEHDYDVQGRSLAELSEQARRELLSEAQRWTAAYRDVGHCDADEAGLVFLAGHQPEIFHPGVWLKNFTLGALARHPIGGDTERVPAQPSEGHFDVLPNGPAGAVAVNLLIDGDTVGDPALRVPAGSVAEPRIEVIPFDRPEPRIPYELRRIEDRRMFATFGRRVARRIAPLVPDPLIEAYWPLVQQRMQQTENLGACLAQARHQLEAAWGLQTLEIPQSRICESEPFCWLVAHLLARLPRLWQIYNESVREYRRVHRTRSATHPVPELAAQQQWLEAPLWIFSAEDPRRRRLFARQQGDQIVLSDRQGLEIGLPLKPEGNATRTVTRLMELGRQGVKIRSRALITTLWARLALGDLFLHGIGGAKYDQVTDLLIERFFGLSPPGFMVLSATLHLPIERERVGTEQPGAIRQQLRRLVYHPERYIDANNRDRTHGDQDPAELMAEKARWVQTPLTPRNARMRCQAIRRINRALQPWVQPRREGLLQLQAQAARALRAEQILASREYGFCLYPEKTFRGFVRGLLPKNG
jgi:hypothetical protein